ncbi:MAG TPA: S8 family serine peptidase [Caldilineaceae bacterium]|nr:S8 family serine peptidase [Caldilineaceae bacterium]
MNRLPLARLLAGFLTMLFVMGGALVEPAAAQQSSHHRLFLPALQGGAEQVADAAAAPGLQQVIVVLRPDVPDPAAVAAEMVERHQGRLGFVYRHALKGFSASLPAAALQGIQHDPRVAYVEMDQEVHIFAQQTPTGIQRSFAASNTNLDIDGSDDLRVDVDVAVIDTGVDFQHPDLNVVGGVNCTGGSPFRASCKSGGDDDHYHGTHVAGAIAAIDNGIGVVGVAPGARIWAVKVLNSQGSGYTSWIVAGIDWVTANAGAIEVANMSLGGSGFSQAQYDAIQSAVNKGIAFAVAAGNSDANAANYSPAGFDNVLTVSALADFNGASGGGAAPTCRDDQDDTLADFSNWGAVVDIAAPGVCILSTYPLEQGEYGAISGTSMASPHAAGALALLASRNNPNNASDVSNLYGQVKSKGNFNWTDDSGDGIQEPLLDLSDASAFNPVTVAGSGNGGANTPPTASFTYSCTGLSCTFDASSSSDSDGTITGYAWNFGDGNSGAGASLSHDYAAGGVYQVRLEVTDNGGATDSEVQSVVVSAPGSGISLTANGYKVKGIQHVDLTWSGATSTNVDIFRNGAKLTTTANDGLHTDNIGQKGGGAYTYKVCEAGASLCSNEVTVTF